MDPVFNAGPLTTVFTAPSSCFTPVRIQDNGEFLGAIWGYRCTTTTTIAGDPRIQQATIDSSCYPPGTQSYPMRYGLAVTLGGPYFSPASQCPQGWTAAVSGTNATLFPGIAPDETGVVCCPSDMTWRDRCQAPSTGITATIGVCDPQGTTMSTTTVVTTFATREVQGDSGWIYQAANVVLRYKSSDAASTPPPNPAPDQTSSSEVDTASPSPTSTASLSGSLTTDASAPAPASGKGGGLSTGAKAAIGVIVPLAVIALIALASIFLRRRKQAQNHADVFEPVSGQPGLIVAEKGGHPGVYHPGNPELDSTLVHPPPPLTYSQQKEIDAHEVAGSSVPPNVVNRRPLLGTTAEFNAQPASHEMLGSSPPVELSDNDRFTYPAEMSSERSQAHSTYSETLASESGAAHRQDYLGELKARKAAVASERERLERMERLREEEEKLEQAIREVEERRRY